MSRSGLSMNYLKIHNNTEKYIKIHTKKKKLKLKMLTNLSHTANKWYNQGMNLDSTDFIVTKMCQIYVNYFKTI